MVTCQSANQLKTPANVAWAFKMVSQFGFTRLHNHGEELLIWQLSRRQSLTPFTRRVDQPFLAKRSCSQSAVSKHVNRKLGGRKRCTTNREKPQTYEACQAKSIQEFGVGELHKEWTEAGVKASRAPHKTCRGIGYSCHQRRLTWAKRRRTGLLPSGPSPLFRWEQVLYFIWKPRVLESGGRVEKLIAQVAWPPGLSFHSLWWFGVQCHFAGVGSTVLFENQHHCTRLPRNFGALHASFCWPAF